MKRYGNLFDQFLSFTNLFSAYRKARKGTARKRSTLAFSFHLERELFELQKALHAGTYKPSPYHYFKIYDPKERTISIAEFQDRVVHHALINILEPIYERCFIFDSYATRKNKGTHKALERAQHMMRHNYWFFKTDVDKYFDSIEHDVLLKLLERKVKDHRLMQLAEKIIRLGGLGVGLPIGNLTSQFFANVYLNGFDHFVKHQLKAQNYIRYMDDFVLFSQDRHYLKDCRSSIEDYLKRELGLRLKSNATFLNHAENGLTFLGRRVFPGTIRLARPNWQRMRKRMEAQIDAFNKQKIDEEVFLQSMNSYWAILEPFKGLRHQFLTDKQQ